MSYHKIWWKNGNPNKIISTGKSHGEENEHYFYSEVVPEDDEFYTIDQGPPQLINRKSQAVIDAIILTRSEDDLNHRLKMAAALSFLRQNFLTDLSFSEIDSYIHDNIPGTPNQQQFFIDIAKIVSSILKINDYSK